MKAFISASTFARRMLPIAKATSFSLVDKFGDKILSRKTGSTVSSCSGYTERGYRRIRVVIPAANANTTSKACTYVGWGSHVQHIPIGACCLVVHNQ